MTLRLRIALFVLYFEAISNIAAGVVFMAAPALFAGPFLGHMLTPSSVEMGRWYGVTLFIMSATQLAVLPARQEPGTADRRAYNSANSSFASFRSRVSKPSVNQA